jgi:hypothetical protein
MNREEVCRYLMGVSMEGGRAVQVMVDSSSSRRKDLSVIMG